MQLMWERSNHLLLYTVQSMFETTWEIWRTLELRRAISVLRSICYMEWTWKIRQPQNSGQLFTVKFGSLIPRVHWIEYLCHKCWMGRPCGRRREVYWNVGHIRLSPLHGTACPICGTSTPTRIIFRYDLPFLFVCSLMALFKHHWDSFSYRTTNKQKTKTTTKTK